MFKEAEECVREYIGAYIADVRAGIDVPNEFGIDINHPFHGLFQRETEEYRYTINYTKGIYYELGETAVVARVYNADFSTERYYYEVEEDPLSLLLGYGKRPNRENGWGMQLEYPISDRKDSFGFLEYT